MQALEIQVLSGIHEGARYAVVTESFRLAGDEHAEIILLDEDVEALEIAFRRTGEDTLGLMSRADYDIVDATGMPVHPKTLWRYGQFLVVGGVWLALAAAGEPLLQRPVKREPELAQVFSAALKKPSVGAVPVAAPAKARQAKQADSLTPEGRQARKMASIALGSIIALVLVAGLGVAALAVTADKSIEEAQAEQARLPKVSLAAVSATSATMGPSPEELTMMRISTAREALTRMLERGGLAASVEVKWEAGQVAVNATINPGEVAQFERLIADFERDHGASVKVQAKVTPLWTTLPFRIREVVPGNTGWLVTDSGERVLLGGELAGYKVSSLGPEKVVLSGPRRVEIDL